jgi:holliday junction DNA helicase RuvA
LRRKVPKFALLVAREIPYEADVEADVVRETYDALRTLGHSESDARRLIDSSLGQKKKYKDVQELIQAIYQQSRADG